MAITPNYAYKQLSGQGCLAVCLAYLCGFEPNRDYEQYMVGIGGFIDRDSFVLGMAEAFMAFGQFESTVLRIGFDRPRYAHYLQRQEIHQNLTIEHCDVYGMLQADTIQRPYIVYLDRHELGAYYHYPHFVLVLKHTPQTYIFFDPWDGRTKRHRRTKIMQAVSQLDEHLHVCPAIIQYQFNNKCECHNKTLCTIISVSL